MRRERLSDQECRVVDLVARGMTNPEIAVEMFLSFQTVKSHLHHIGRKLDARNRAHIVARAMETGQWWPPNADTTVTDVNARWAARMDGMARRLHKTEEQRDEYRRKYLKALETIMDLREGEKT